MAGLRVVQLVGLGIALSLSSFAVADVDVSMNVRRNSPTDPAMGAEWTLVARTDTPGSQGLVAIVLRFLDLPEENLTASASQAGSGVQTAMFGDETEFLITFSSMTEVGLPTNPLNLLDDPLGDNANWANTSVIASGSIQDVTALPRAFSAESNEFDASGQIVAGPIGTFVVRTAIPEPSTAGIALIGLLGAAAHRR